MWFLCQEWAEHHRGHAASSPLSKRGKVRPEMPGPTQEHSAKLSNFLSGEMGVCSSPSRVRGSPLGGCAVFFGLLEM